ncbi:hypothetical protein IL38_06975 [Actinopolyspora erythraea]|uniref:Uncharacterized protein n=1 Tax=Actinopolyspora erythraea TaxID=414996 RepID=A0ABR4X5U6_9ACTN|nr:hypothetical protein IL38_06975 [Actinopolyspora erythraea]
MGKDFVVEYDPNIPPSEYMKLGGFAYRERELKDGDLIIRVNEYTTLTNEGKKLWRMPPRFPSI